MDDDHMEFGQGLVSLPDGWMMERETGNKIAPNGDVFNLKGERIWSNEIADAYIDEEYDR